MINKHGICMWHVHISDQVTWVSTVKEVLAVQPYLTSSALVINVTHCAVFGECK